MKLFSSHLLLSFFLVLFFFFGGYLGYLSALVDVDEQEFIERVSAATDKARLEKQLKRARSILDARSRAYLKRGQEFLRKEQGIKVPEPQNIRDEIKKVLEQDLSREDLERLKSLLEEEKDLDFFEAEVKVLETLLARQPEEEEVRLASKKKKLVTSKVDYVLKLLDKQKELKAKRKQVQEGFRYWQQNPRPANEGIPITVTNKDGLPRDMNPLHLTQVSTALSLMPAEFDGRLKNLYIVYGDSEMRRGMSGVGVVFMKGEDLDFFRVLVHEFGHIFDLYREVGSGTKSDFYDGEYRLFEEDPSVTFYRYSWKNTFERIADEKTFASFYGTTDPFEDFAEAYALFILQQPSFSVWIKKDALLIKKFQYLKTVFHDKIFPSSTVYSSQPYDVTMLSVDYETLLGR